MKNKHNGIISFWKFIYSLIIIIFHGRLFAEPNASYILFSKGSIAVEFFFIVSGYLLANSALKNESIDNPKDLGKETIKFIFKKIKTFFPYIFIFYISTLIVTIIYQKLSIYQVISSIWSLFMLNIAGFKGIEINGVVWYIGAMLICMLFLYPLIRKYKYNFIYIVSPLIIILLGGWLNHDYNSLRSPYVWLGFANKGLIRSFMVLNIGIVLYPIVKKLSKLNFTKFGKFCITIIEISGFVAPLLINHFLDSASKYDFVVLVILSIAIILAFSGKTLEYKFMNNKVSYFLEKISLPMYLSHICIRTIMINSNLFLNLTYYNKLLILIISTMVISFIVMKFVELLNKKNCSKKIKKIFLK